MGLRTCTFASYAWKDVSYDGCRYCKGGKGGIGGGKGLVVKVLEVEYGQLLETGCRHGIVPCLVAQYSPEGAIL